MARILTDESSLTRRRKYLSKESVALQKIMLAEGALALLLALAGGVFVFMGREPTGWLAGAAVLGFLAVGHWQKIRANEQEHKSVSAGLKGEQEVTRLLKEALGNDCYILNDISIRHGWKSAQIDHLVVTPRGIFVIETKTWRGEITGDEQDAQWKQVRHPGDKPIHLRNPILQNRRQITILRLFLKGKGIDWPDVFPVLVSKSKRGTFHISNATVPILRSEEAADHIFAQTCDRTYTEAEVTAVIHELMRTL